MSTTPTCTIVATGKTFGILAGKTVLESAEFAKIQLPFGCRAGACGSCYINVLAGMEHIPAPTHIEEDTLTKIGKVGQGRLACRIRNLTGPIKIQLR